MQNAIEITGLRKTYGAQKGAGPKEALKGVDLAIPAGSIFGLLGPNGAGKSTLINILAGLVTKTSGQVRIWGFDQDVNPRQSRAAIGVMPQELNMDPFFTPRGALEVQAGLYGVPKSQRRTDEILALIGLSDKAEAYARALSGGMRRRLLLAKALVHRPHVLVLDEPTAGVDIELRQMLWEWACAGIGTARRGAARNPRRWHAGADLSAFAGERRAALGRCGGSGRRNQRCFQRRPQSGRCIPCPDSRGGARA